MKVHELENAETVSDRFKNADRRLLGLPDDMDIGRRIACQTYQALLSITNYPREQLSDDTLMYAIAAGVSDALCRFTKQEDLEGLTEEFVETIRDGNRFKIDEGIRSETLLWPISLADEKSLSAGIAERLEKRLRFDEWHSRIFNGDESVSIAEFDRRAQSDPEPTGALQPHWQTTRTCKEVISRLEANHPIVAAAELLLKEIEAEQRDGVARAKSCVVPNERPPV